MFPTWLFTVIAAVVVVVSVLLVVKLMEGRSSKKITESVAPSAPSVAVPEPQLPRESTASRKEKKVLVSFFISQTAVTVMCAHRNEA